MFYLHQITCVCLPTTLFTCNLFFLLISFKTGENFPELNVPLCYPVSFVYNFTEHCTALCVFSFLLGCPFFNNSNCFHLLSWTYEHMHNKCWFIGFSYNTCFNLLFLCSLHFLYFSFQFLYMLSSSEMIGLFQRTPRGKWWTDIYFPSALRQDSKMFNSLTFFFCFRDVWLISLTTEILLLLSSFTPPQLHFLLFLLLSLC